MGHAGPVGLTRGDAGGAAGGDRLTAFSTEAEEQWLTGAGPAPASPAQRLPSRAPVMLPREGAGRWAAVARRARLWVRADGALLLRGPDGPDRVLLRPGPGRAGWWLVDDGPAGAGLPVAPGGWFVITGRGRPLVALRLAQWLPGGAEHGAGAGLVRAAGAEAVCRALGAPFEAVGDPAEAGLRIGRVPPGARVELRPAAGPSAALVMAGAGALAVAAAALLAVRQDRAAWASAAVAVLAPAVADLAAWWARRRRVRCLPARLGAWWQAAPSRGVPGRGIGLRDGPGGQELVLADGHGGECWLAGPGGGGVAGLVAIRDAPGRPPWGLLLYDRGEQLLAGLRGADWAAGPGAWAALYAGAARLGLVVSDVTEPAQPMRSTRESAGARRALAGPWPTLAATRLSLLLAAAIGLTAVFTGPPLARDVFGACALILMAGRAVAARRTVL